MVRRLGIHRRQCSLLVENSSEFDNWLNEVVFDLENFRTGGKDQDKGTPKSIPEE